VFEDHAVEDEAAPSNRPEDPYTPASNRPDMVDVTEPGEDLAQLLEDDPESGLAAVKLLLSQESASRSTPVELAIMVAEESGVNIFRVMHEHPDVVSELWGDLEITPSLIDRVDAYVEAG